jgi:GH25 family lysozyme M1 (1,4-beta-N-acetylmuramidase)
VTLRIPDVSEFQSLIDWRALIAYLRATYGGAAAIVRLCYGDLHVDLYADRNIDGARGAGADVLAWYLYLVAGRAPELQAATLARVLLAHGGLRSNEFVVVDDEESTGGDESGRVNAALAELDRQLKTADPGGQDWWYSGLNFALVHNLPAARGHRFVAAYQGTEPTAIAHDLWQSTDAASFPGIGGPVDSSLYHGSIEDLRRLVGAPGGDTLDLNNFVDRGVYDGVLRILYSWSDRYQYVRDPATGLMVKMEGQPNWLPDTVAAAAADAAATRALVTALVASEGVEAIAIKAIGDNAVAASSIALVLAANAGIKAELDNVAAAQAGGTPADLAALVAAVAVADHHILATATHLGYNAATGADS